MHEKNTVTRRGFMMTAAAAGLGLRAARAQDTQRAPNIVFLMTDDQRWDTIGCAGNPIMHTPHLDALCADGTRFANCFASTSICYASRASVLTGLHTRSHGLEGFGQPLTGEGWDNTYPAILRKAGYYTGFIGKWGIGGDLPTEAFDYFEGFAGQGQYFLDEDETEHLTAKLGDDALAFFDEAPGDRPFCLSVSFKAPHVQDVDPRQFLPDPKLAHLYEDVEIPVPETADPKYFEQLPEFIRNSEGRVRWERRFATPEAYQTSVKNYYRLISGVDREVGRIRALLAERGLAANTVIVFTSDQGFFLGEHGLAGKWLQYEESIRMPLLVHDPRVPKSGRAGVREEMAMNLDLCPTILELAGITPAPFMQGRSLVPLLSGGTPPWRHECFFEHDFASGDPEASPFIPGSEAIRTARWKYVRYYHGDPPFEQLFDLDNDPHETTNLVESAEHTALLERLRGRWETWTGALARWDRGRAWADPA